jgi:uncharacterized oligopeptide transporter (OPT) family protein
MARDLRVQRGRSELSLRAVVLGCSLGALLAAGNVYTGLKTGYIDGGSITAAVVGFAFFAALRGRNARMGFSVGENNLTQTIASSAAVMSFTTGIVGPIAALSLSGHRYSPWAIALWGIVLAPIGIGIARALRERLIVREALPFPTGRATAEVIAAMHAGRGAALAPAALLAAGVVAAAVITWFRDGRPSVLPQALFLPGGPAAMSAASLWLGVSLSPMMLASGALIGPRASSGVLLGSVGAWGLLAPALLAAKWVAAADYAALLGWLLWPGVALLVSGSLTTILLDWRSVREAFRDLRLRRSPPLGAADAGAELESRGWLLLVLLPAGLAVLLAWQIFDVHPLVTSLVLVFSVVMAAVGARAAGETDIAPVGSAGALGQILFGAPSLTTSLISGGVVAANATQTAQMMWAFKAGHRLKTDPNTQAAAQMLGVVVGALVVVPVYDLVSRAYGIGTVRMPAPTAISWKATAEAVQLGTAAMPNHAAAAAALGCALGVALTVLGRTRFKRYLPSPVTLGIAFLIPAPLAGAIFLGGVAFAALRAWRPVWTEQRLPTLAAGAIAGESLTGVLIAALLASGLLSG